MAEFENKNMFEDKSPPKSKKLRRAEKRYTRAHKKAEYAGKKLPKKKKRRDTALQRATRRAFMEAQFYVHGKISENEHDNAGLEAAHKSEEAAEELVRFAKYNLRGRKGKNRRKYERAKRYEFQTGTALAYKKYLEENPEIAKKILQKRLQKERIKKEYAKQLYKKVKESEKSGEALRETKNLTTLVASKIAEVVREHAVGATFAGLFGLFFMLITTMISSCGAMLGGGTTTIMAGAYQSMPLDIDAAEDSFKLKEMYLQNDIDSTETVYSGYDEYVYDLDHIGHNPFTLINYLSAVYGVFTSYDVESEIQAMFDEMYSLTFTPSEETRTRTVTTTTPGDMPGEDIITTEEEEYTVTIMTVKLRTKPLEDIVSERLTGNDEAVALYTAYGDTHGALQRFWSPVQLDWMSRISCYYGYRVHPISGENQFHRGLDIAIPEGTELYASMDGTVLYARYDDSYGNYIVLQDDRGYSVRYAHMSSLSVSEGQIVTHGDLVGYSGNTGGSTGPHLHLECTYGSDYYNPIFYFVNGTG